MYKKTNQQGAKILLFLLAIASVFVVACKKSSVKPLTAAQQAAAADSAASAAQTTALIGQWTDGKEEQIVYDSTHAVIKDTVFNTGNNYHYDQYNSNGTYYYVDNEFALDTQAMYKFKVSNNAITYTNPTDSAYTYASIVQLTSTNLETEYIFNTKGSASVQVQMFHLDSTKTYTVNFFKYFTKQ
jgi:hypothetical protein